MTETVDSNQSNKKNAHHLRSVEARQRRFLTNDSLNGLTLNQTLPFDGKILTTISPKDSVILKKSKIGKSNRTPVGRYTKNVKRLPKYFANSSAIIINQPSNNNSRVSIYITFAYTY